VDAFQWLLMLHVAAAFCFVSGSVAAGVLNILAIRAERPSESAQLLRLVRATLPVVGIGSLGTIALGIALWQHQHYPLDAFWIWAAIVLWLVANALGGMGGRHQQQARELAERLAAEGDVSNDVLHDLLEDPRGNALSWLAGIATLLILVLMIWKP
jgi:uncharacterized membrane protein